MSTLAEVTLYPPEQYSPLWLVLGVGCVLAVVVGYLATFLLTRAPGVETEPKTQVAPAPSLAELKDRFLSRLSALERGQQPGRIPDRNAFIELSALVRRFVFEASDVNAHTSTLAELRGITAATVSEAVAGIYPAAFEQRSPDVSFAQSLARVREVVTTWS